ncbi:MAG: ABC transporter ATP-binding protein [Gammaproteobacteria bacterium]|nr:ABC transporter ATP-binding protein [Gammaproteobacteria bacterium]
MDQAARASHSSTLAETGAPHLRIAGLSKRFGAQLAVDDVSLDVARGELFCLLGGSGCGKTTLLRMLAGFEAPSAGRVLLDGVDVTALPPHRRPVNMMFQSYALFPHKNVRDNIAFGLEQERCPRAEREARVGAMLELLQLEGLERRRPHQLSGGQRQRVALARALVKQPRLLLLDEPLGALDRKLREATQFELKQLQQALGITFVVVTHDQAEAMTLATRIGVMDQGRLVQVGTPREIYERPGSRHVADFVGSTNLFEVELEKRDAHGLHLRATELDCTLLLSNATPPSPGGPLWLALRPEQFVMARESPVERGPNCVAGVIREVAYQGGASFYQVVLPSGRGVKVSRANVADDGAASLERGDRVWLRWSATSGVLLAQ